MKTKTVTAALGWLLALGLAARAGAAELEVTNAFAVVGTPVELIVRGEPGASYRLFLSRTPAREPADQLGTWFLASGTRMGIGSGTLDAAGEGRRLLPISPAAAPGRLFYAQALVLAPGAPRLSNAVPFRTVTDAPAGRRVTRAVTASLDGTKVYAAHAADGSVSVVDAATGQRIRELPVSVAAADIPHRSLDLAVDPDGRHLYAVSAAAAAVAVVDAASDSVVAQLSVPRGTRRVAFDFSGTADRIYFSNEVANAVLVFEEQAAGVFTALPSLPLQGDDPGPLLVLDDGRLAVGQRAPAAVEIIDPRAPPGSTTIGRIALAGLPFDLVALPGAGVLIPTFEMSGVPGVEGSNRVLTLDPDGLAITGALLENTGTDYVDVAADGGLVAVVAASSGNVLIADEAGTLLASVELAPGAPTATPQDAAFVTGAGGEPLRLYVANYFRETLRVIELAAGPPFALGAEIALGWSGQPRVPLTGALSLAEDGDWFFRSVNLFGGDADNPNRATCFSCHVDGVADNLARPRQVPPLWGSGETAPYFATGNGPSLAGAIAGAINRHNSLGLPSFPGADALIEQFLRGLAPPASIYLRADGTPGAAAQAGRVLFEGAAGCVQCHAAPAFIPLPPAPLTVASGIGTGLVPANVPSLRGLWATAPYLHNGSARTLLEVLTNNPADTHGQLAAALTEAQRAQLVAYLLTL